MANPVIKIKRGSTTPANGVLAAGELAVDLTNLNLFVGKADGSVLTVGGEGTFATKAYADSAVSAANTSLTTSLNAEISRAQAAESDLADDISAEEAARVAAVSSEAASRVSGDNALDAKITTEKGRIDAILSASTADKDSFAEIVQLINSVDTESDTAFAGYVLSNNAALAQEVSDRQAADTTLQSNIDTVSGDLSILSGRVDATEAGISNEEIARANAVISLQVAIDAEASTRASADSALDARATSLEGRATTAEVDISSNGVAIEFEATTRANADSALDARATSLEGRVTTAESDIATNATAIMDEASARSSADSALDVRVTALETTIDGGTY